MEIVKIDYSTASKSEANEYIKHFSDVGNVRIKNKLVFGISEQFPQVIEILASAGVFASLVSFFKIYFSRNKNKIIKITLGERKIELSGYSIKEIHEIQVFLENHNE